ncbi:MAG: TIGR03905 family TSCPD domain-containing protein [Ruminococcaceae bacterium]|nr:TIGR03905 family TSCPD domain-containing protein [Oscillospiraceae bacterium]
MIKELKYKTRGTCSREIDVTLDGDVIVDVKFVAGCSGNTSGVSALVRGMKAEDAIKRLKGIKCGFKNTSCPDQLAIALEQCLKSDS